MTDLERLKDAISTAERNDDDVRIGVELARALVAARSAGGPVPMQGAPGVCAICDRPVEDDDAGAEVRLYLGPGDKLGELWLPLCRHHVARFRPAYERELVECRVTRLVEGVRCS
jgi:hypothetical protein